MEKMRCNVLLEAWQVKRLREREMRTGATISAQVRIAVEFWLKEQAEFERLQAPTGKKGYER